MNKNKNKNKREKIEFHPVANGLAFLIALGGLAFSFYLLQIPLNIKSQLLWYSLIFWVTAFFVLRRLFLGYTDLYFETVKKGKNKTKTKFRFRFVPDIIPIVLIAIYALISISGSAMFNAEKYASILSVEESEFENDLSESLGTDSIALMDTASAQMLGDRELGSLSSVVSQFNVSSEYTQIDFHGKPIKVSALEYAGYFKWQNNKENGVVGYVSVDPVSMNAEFVETKGMKYVPSAYFSENAYRHIWKKYPTLLWGNLHFEIDESGNPYYIASIYEHTISLFDGTVVTGCLVLDPVSGEIEKYDCADIPKWIDVVHDGDLICQQYNWYGMYQNGFLNRIIGKKGCKQVTQYYSGDADDITPISDFGYVSKDSDIWIYTGVTSVNADSSNIGFLLANERTGECRYYSVAGADESSAMASAEGEVQEKGYQASFPSLINVNGNPTYIMVLKDSSGLVKLYAAVNVEQYNIVATASTQKECLSKYRKLIGAKEETAEKPDKKVTITISQIRDIDIDGNTYIYLIDTKNNIYKAKVSQNEKLLLLKVMDKVELSCSGSTILDFEVIS